MKQFVPRRRTSRRSEVWQIIYMDMMTIIMVFFVILWSINQASDEGLTDSVGDTTVRMVSLPSDVLFATGKWDMTAEGEQVFAKLFSTEGGAVLEFDTGGMTRRLLVVQGHTDRVGKKDDNFLLGYRRAFAAYKEIEKHSPEVADHVIICSYADNWPAQQTPEFLGELTEEQEAVVREARSKNRRITIEDKIVSTIDTGEE